MAIIIDSDSITLDETTGLQNTGVAVPGEDNNDNDAGFATLNASFASRLFDPVLSGGLGLDDTFAQNVGIAVNDFITLTDGSQIQGFVDGAGDPFNAFVVGTTDPTTGTLASFTTVDGDAIYLFVDEDSGLGDNMLIGVDATGDIVFSAFLEPDGTMWLVQMEAISNPVTTNPDDPVDLTGLVGVAATTSLEFNFDDLPSGSNLFGVVGQTANAIVVIGRDPVLQADGSYTNQSDVIHTSQGGINATIGVNNQMFDPGDGAYFTYVNDPNPNFLSGVLGGLNATEADDADNIEYTGGTLSASGAAFTISQIQGNALATAKISAFLMADAPQERNFVNTGLGTGTTPEITAIRVFDENGTKIEDTDDLANFNDPNVAVDLTGLTAIVSGLDSGYRVEWDTASVHNQVLIEGVAGKFDIGGFEILETATIVEPVGDRIRFEDDGPTVSANATALLDDDAQAGGNPGGVGDDADSANTSGTLGHSFGTDGGSIAFLTSGAPSGFTYELDGNDLLIKQGTTTVVTVTLDTGTGAYTVTQNAPIVHAAGLDENNQAFTLTYRVTDGDGDTADGTLGINVDDDTPVASGETESAIVQEDDLSTAAGDLSDGIDEAGDPPTDEASGSVSALVTAGADAPATFTLSADTSGLSQTLTSKGDAVTYSVAGNTLTASAGGRTVFTLQLAANGDYTFDLKDQLDHANASGDAATLALDLSSVLVATDADGDSVTPPANAFVINVENDVPIIGPIADGLVDFAAGDTVTNPLNGTVGADEPAAFSVTSSPATISIFDGTPAELTLLRDISSDGTVVTYFDDADNSGTLNAGDTEFFKLTLSGGNYTFDVLQDPPPATLQFDFDTAPSGSNLFVTVGQTANAIVVIGRDPVLQADGTYTNQSDVIHTSQGGIDATIGVNNQMFDPGDGAYFTYVNTPNPNFLSGVPGGLSATEADDADNIEYTGGTLSASSAAFIVSQTQGNALATAKISAFLMAGAPQEQNFVNTGLGTGTTPEITAIRVFDENGTKIEDTDDLANFNDPNVAVDLAGLTAIVSGLDSGYKVEWDTASVHNQVLIEGVAGKFDVGGFELNQPQPTPDEKLDFTVQLADFDGDTASDSFSIGIDGTGGFNDDHVDGVMA